MQPSTSKGTVVIKEEDSPNESNDASRTHFVLVAKPKFIKVESGIENVPASPSSPRKIQNITIEPDDDDDDDAAMMKNSQSSDEGKTKS